MQTFNYEVNFHNFEFICSSRNTRNGFAHHATLIIDGGNGCNLENDCFYYNRTWERYTYQTVMAGLVRKQIEFLIDWRKEEYMRDREYKRMTQKRRDDFARWLDDDPGDWLHSYICLYEAVQNDGIMSPPYPDWYGHRPKSFQASDFVR